MTLQFSHYGRNRQKVCIDNKVIPLFSLLFHVGQAAIKPPSAEASKQAQCTSPGK